MGWIFSSFYPIYPASSDSFGDPIQVRRVPALIHFCLTFCGTQFRTAFDNKTYSWPQFLWLEQENVFRNVTINFVLKGRKSGKNGKCFAVTKWTTLRIFAFLCTQIKKLDVPWSFFVTTLSNAHKLHLYITQNWTNIDKQSATSYADSRT